MNLELFEQLVDRHLDGGLTAEQQVELETAIQSESALRTRYWELSRIHGQLHNFSQERLGRSISFTETPVHAGTAQKTPTQRTPLQMPPRQRGAHKRSWARPILALAASIVLAISLLLPQWITKPPLTQDDAVIIDVAQAEWPQGTSYSVGDSIGAKSFALKKGLAQIRFSSGATMIVTGPAQISVQSPKLATLHNGRITMRVPETAHGFAIQTTGLQVVDLGTEFGVSQQFDQNQPGAEIIVFEGSVEAATPDVTSLPKILRRGEASRINSQGALEQTPYNEKGYIRVMPNELAAAHLEKDIEAWYKFEEKSGTHVSDASGNGHHGVLRYGKIDDMATTGRINGAFEFSGATHVEIPNHPQLTLNEFTLHAWVKPQQKQGGDAQILSKQGSYGLALPDNAAMKFYFWHMDRVIDHAFTPQEWVNLIATFDGTVRRFYVNGVRIATINSPSPPISKEPLRLGTLENRSPDPFRHFKGTIDDIRIYRRALNENEVRLLYLSADNPLP